MKKFFLSRVLREKTLLVAFTLLALVIWGGSAVRRTRGKWTDWRSARSEFATQQIWLNNADAIAAKAAAATASLEPAKTLNAARLVGELSAMAAQVGLTADIGSQRTDERTDQFSFHTVQVNFRNAELEPLLKFYAAFSQRSPYIALEQFSLATNRANPGQLNVSLRVASVELAK